MKDVILASVREEVIPYFEAKGITITVLGMKDGIEYDDAAIQNAINEKFSSEQKLVTQQNENEVALAKADAEVLHIKSEAEAEANRKIAESLTPELLELKLMEAYISKWDGSVPTIQGETNSFMDISNLLNK